jgi:membrane associated rhomboid family serine protease
MIPLRDDNPSRITPWVTYAVFGACLLVYLWQLSLGPRLQGAVYSFGLIPAVLFGQVGLPPELELIPPLASVFTSMFMHGSVLHIASNMLYLWIFADNIEDTLGHARFALFYLLCGVAAALAQALPDPASQIPMIGASGAISGVLGAYLILFPRANVLVLVPLGFILTTVRLPAMVVLGLWFALQLVSSAMAPPGSGGVAFGAHIGGFVAGMVLIHLFPRQPVAARRRTGPRTYRR